MIFRYSGAAVDIAGIKNEICVLTFVMSASAHDCVGTTYLVSQFAKDGSDHTVRDCMTKSQIFSVILIVINSQADGFCAKVDDNPLVSNIRVIEADNLMHYLSDVRRSLWS